MMCCAVTEWHVMGFVYITSISISWTSVQLFLKLCSGAVSKNAYSLSFIKAVSVERVIRHHWFDCYIFNTNNPLIRILNRCRPPIFEHIFESFTIMNEPLIVSRASKSTKLTLSRISRLTADDIWLWPQNKHGGIWMSLLLFHTSLTTAQHHDSCRTAVFGFLRSVWEIFMNCEVNFIFSLSLFFSVFSSVPHSLPQEMWSQGKS